jgi:4-hydroxybenzoate polyprenyltransferase
MSKLENDLGPAVVRPTLKGHIQVSRIDHWFKNVFVFPGIVAAVGITGSYDSGLWIRMLVGLLSICLVASSNYVINEVLDAPSDLSHPVKSKRPVPAGLVNVPLAYVQWILLMVVGVALGLAVNTYFAATVLVLWIMGCIYNIPPVRSKDLPYVDVLSEAVNNPLRMLAGWYIVGTATAAPASLLLSYWMIGCYFMGMKRYAEYRDIADPARAAAYRKSFAYYTEERLLVSVMFYGTAAMLFLGAFIMRYKLELILSFPFIALVMAIYLSLAFRKNSAVQRPEGLYKEPTLMVAVFACTIVVGILLLVRLPVLQSVFSPTAPTISGAK